MPRFSFSSLVFAFVLLALTSGCEPETPCRENWRVELSGAIVRELSPRCGASTPQVFPETSGTVIRDSAEFEAFFESENCAHGIDFSRQCLVGITVRASCQVDGVRKEARLLNDSSMLYRVELDQCGNCEALVRNVAWVLLDRPAGDLQFVFESEVF